MHTEQLGENKLVITQCQSVYNFSDDETYECASLFKKSGEMIVGGLPYMPIQANESYVMQTNMRDLTYTILNDGSYTVKGETYYEFVFKNKSEKAQVDIYDINNESITLEKNEAKKKILLEKSKDSGSKGDKQTFVIPETNLVYTQRNNKFFEISYDLGTADEISKEKYVQKFEDGAKNYLYHTSANGVTIVSDVIDREYFDGRVYCAIMNKDGKVRNGRWFFTVGKYIYEYNPFDTDGNYVIRLNPDLTKDTTFDQAKFNRIFEYKGKTYFYNDKAPSEMYDENGARVELK